LTRMISSADWNCRVHAAGRNYSGIEAKKAFMGLEVFKHLVETTNIRAFILEGDMGGCALINEYIHDPLAYQVKRLPGNQYYLDFSKVDPNSALGKKINGKTKMGSIGEKYSVMFKILKKCYQLEQVPSEKYNAMIYVYEASPIEVWEN